MIVFMIENDVVSVKDIDRFNGDFLVRSWVFHKELSDNPFWQMWNDATLIKADPQEEMIVVDLDRKNALSMQNYASALLWHPQHFDLRVYNRECENMIDLNILWKDQRILSFDKKDEELMRRGQVLLGGNPVDLTHEEKTDFEAFCVGLQGHQLYPGAPIMLFTKPPVQWCVSDLHMDHDGHEVLAHYLCERQLLDVENILAWKTFVPHIEDIIYETQSQHARQHLNNHLDHNKQSGDKKKM